MGLRFQKHCDHSCVALIFSHSSAEIVISHQVTSCCHLFPHNCKPGTITSTRNSISLQDTSSRCFFNTMWFTIWLGGGKCLAGIILGCCNDFNAETNIYRTYLCNMESFLHFYLLLGPLVLCLCLKCLILLSSFKHTWACEISLEIIYFFCWFWPWYQLHLLLLSDNRIHLGSKPSNKARIQ